MRLQEDLPHPEVPADLAALRYRVLGAAFRVHTALGPSMKESFYRRCLAHALRNDGLRVEEEVAIDVIFEGLPLDRALRLDLVVEDQIVIEVKASDVALSVWNAQVLSYLWHTGLPLGYLINFRTSRLRNGIRPFVNLPRVGPEGSASGPLGPLRALGTQCQAGEEQSDKMD